MKEAAPTCARPRFPPGAGRPHIDANTAALIVRQIDENVAEIDLAIAKLGGA